MTDSVSAANEPCAMLAWCLGVCLRGANYLSQSGSEYLFLAIDQTGLWLTAICTAVSFLFQVLSKSQMCIKDLYRLPPKGYLKHTWHELESGGEVANTVGQMQCPHLMASSINANIVLNQSHSSPFWLFQVTGAGNDAMTDQQTNGPGRLLLCTYYTSLPIISAQKAHPICS